MSLRYANLVPQISNEAVPIVVTATTTAAKSVVIADTSIFIPLDLKIDLKIDRVSEMRTQSPNKYRLQSLFVSPV